MSNDYELPGPTEEAKALLKKTGGSVTDSAALGDLVTCGDPETYGTTDDKKAADELARIEQALRNDGWAVEASDISWMIRVSGDFDGDQRGLRLEGKRAELEDGKAGTLLSDVRRASKRARSPGSPNQAFLVNTYGIKSIPWASD